MSSVRRSFPSWKPSEDPPCLSDSVRVRRGGVVRADPRAGDRKDARCHPEGDARAPMSRRRSRSTRKSAVAAVRSHIFAPVPLSKIPPSSISICVVSPAASPPQTRPPRTPTPGRRPRRPRARLAPTRAVRSRPIDRRRRQPRPPRTAPPGDPSSESGTALVAADRATPGPRTCPCPSFAARSVSSLRPDAAAESRGSPCIVGPATDSPPAARVARYLPASPSVPPHPGGASTRERVRRRNLPRRRRSRVHGVVLCARPRPGAGASLGTPPSAARARRSRGFAEHRHVHIHALAESHHGSEVLQVYGDVDFVRAVMLVPKDGVLGGVEGDGRCNAWPGGAFGSACSTAGDSRRGAPSRCPRDGPRTRPRHPLPLHETVMSFCPL